jgi:ribosomal protein S18 acetylase RimI-like enzyme
MLAIRRAEENDRTAILAAAQDVGVFTKDEVACVDELLDVYLHRPDQQDYDFWVGCDDNDSLVGFSCHGPTPMTEGTFDLYWLCVSSHAQGQGVASALLKRVEQQICAQSGRLLVAETSSTPPYRPARAFYEGHGFRRRT